MKARDTRTKLLEHLRKRPIVHVACERAGVSRATYYRWRKADASFAAKADEAIREGEELVNDMAESQLIAAIRDGNMTAVSYWLKHHSDRYTTRLEVSARHEHVTDELTEDQAALIKKALALTAIPLPEPEERSKK